MGSKTNDWCLYKRQEREIWTQRLRGWCENTEAGSGVNLPQAKKHPEAGRSVEGFSPRALEKKRGPADALFPPNSGDQNWEGLSFCSFQPHSLWRPNSSVWISLPNSSSFNHINLPTSFPCLTPSPAPRHLKSRECKFLTRNPGTGTI